MFIGCGVGVRDRRVGSRRMINYTIIHIITYLSGAALATEIECKKETTTTRHVDAQCSQNYKELKQRKQRCKDLTRIVQKMTTKKQLMVSERSTCIYIHVSDYHFCMCDSG